MKSDGFDYEALRTNFTWQKARDSLDGLPGGRGLNIAHEAVDRHAFDTETADHIAIVWRSIANKVEKISYAELADASNRFANAMKRLGIKAGDKIFCFTGRIPELYICCLGTLKLKAVFSPLFSIFGPEPVRTRLSLGDARVLVTTPELFRKKIAPIRDRISHLRHIIVVSHTPLNMDDLPSDILSFDEIIANEESHYVIPDTAPEDPALLHFTSGTTGNPKGVLHVHEAIIAHHATASMVFDLKKDDIFWCTADPGWVTGTSYGIIAPLSHGITMIVDEGEFDPESWYRLLDEERVTIWYTAPTAIRMLMRAGDDLPLRFNLDALRLIASVGEALNPGAVVWGQRVLGTAIRDNWWQTETGGIMIANLPEQPIKPGSMGRPLPGIEAAIVERLENQSIKILTSPEIPGELAIKSGWPSMFRSYISQPERYRQCFIDDWYLTGDLAKKDADGYFWFIGRNDDVIKTAGHLIGPIEVESTLMEHPDVAEAAVIGKPHPILGETVTAFISLKIGKLPNEDLRREILALARKNLGPAVAPREIIFLNSLPKTRSGKIMRRLLKARELGLPEGDTSTLEPSLNADF